MKNFRLRASLRAHGATVIESGEKSIEPKIKPNLAPWSTHDVVSTIHIKGAACHKACDVQREKCRQQADVIDADEFARRGFFTGFGTRSLPW